MLAYQDHRADGPFYHKLICWNDSLMPLDKEGSSAYHASFRYIFERQTWQELARHALQY